MEHRNLGRFVPAMAVVLLLTTGPLIAAEEGEETAAPAAGETQSTQDGLTAESAGTAAGREETIDIVGRDVLDLGNERIGKVTNVLIGSSGRVEAVVLSTGGMLGLGSREYEIPWDRIAMSPDGQDVMVGVAKDDVETEFSAFEVPQSPEPAVIEEPESGSEVSE